MHFTHEFYHGGKLLDCVLKIGFVFLILTVAGTDGATAKDILVPDDYTTIEEAIISASFGDRICEFWLLMMTDGFAVS